MNKIAFVTWIMHSNLTNKLESVKSEMCFYISALTFQETDDGFETTA